MLSIPANPRSLTRRSFVLSLGLLGLLIAGVIGLGAALNVRAVPAAPPAPVAAPPSQHVAAPVKVVAPEAPVPAPAQPAPQIAAVAEAPLYAGPSVIVERPVVLRYGPANSGWVFQITAEQLRQAAVRKANGVVTLDKTKLQGYLKPIADTLRAPAQDARLSLAEGKATLVADQPGLDLDVAAAVTRIQQAATDSNVRVVTLPLKPVEAGVKTAAVRPLYEQVQTLLAKGFVLHYNGDDYKLKPATMARFLVVTPTGTLKNPYTIAIDQDKLIDTLDVVAGQVNVAARDPLYRLQNGQITTVIAPKPGRKLDYTATAAAMTTAFNAGASEADMVVTVRQPSVSEADLSNIQTPDLLGRASTSFSGSSSGRAHNVKFGAAIVDGTLIPPGAIFSMNDALGPLTLARGFQMGYGIARDGDGNLTTVPAEAGGICQVATTFFQSSYWAGLPVVERRNHSYWIPRYGQGTSGRMGLDATISPPDQDLRVKNTTGNWIRVHAYSNGETVLFELFGTNPGWTIKVTGPVIKNTVKTTNEVIHEESDLMPKGQQVMAEHKQDGFDASITRKVYDKDGTLIDNVTLYSHYAPAHDRILTGTGKSVPKP
jgi:vancomycin resistance protein YoaR